MTTALLIIDVQRALCAGEYECHDAKRVIDTINGLSARARQSGVPVVLIQHNEKDSPVLKAGNWLTDWSPRPAICASTRLPTTRSTRPICRN